MELFVQLSGEVNNLEKLYTKLPFDLAGSRSKNRFRNEILWGLEKIYDVYKTGKDFCMIFDYVCDIELHMDSILEFYQIKTNSNSSPYSITKITKLEKDGHSIYGKIYLLKNIAKSEDEKIKVKIAIVANTPLRSEDKKLHSSESELELVVLDDVSKETINSRIKAELSLEKDIIFDDSFYIYTSMDLFDPKSSLVGKTVDFFIEVTGREPKKIMALYRLLADTISDKATHEQMCNSYDELCEKKGIRRTEFEKLIKAHIDIASEAVTISKSIIDDCYSNFSERVHMNGALAQIVQDLTFNKSLMNLELDLSRYISHHLDEMNKDIVDIIKELYQLFAGNFDPEYNQYNKQAFIIYVLAKYQEGLYEKDGD